MISKILKKYKPSPMQIWVASVPVFIIALFVFRASSYWQFRILMGAVVVYLLAALMHHHKDKTLTLEIMIEYILLAVLVLIIAQGLFY